MKREEKNQQARRRILDAALDEFARRGYGGSSVNAICASQGIAKGNLYHYFKNKDDLYLACVQECFARLAECLQPCAAAPGGDAHGQLAQYFRARMDFFREHPVYQPIFCEAVVSPPAALAQEVLARRQAFDALNAQILGNLLATLPLRAPYTRDEAVETLRQFQDFINARHPLAGVSAQEFALREESCRRALDILLYGVIERKEDQHG